MSDKLTIAGIVTGVILTLVYTVYVNRQEASIQLGDIIVLFLANSGVFTGANVMVFAFNPDLLDLVRQEGISVNNIFLGGLSLCAASVFSAVKAFKTVRKTIPSKQSQPDSDSNSNHQPPTERPPA